MLYVMTVLAICLNTYLIGFLKLKSDYVKALVLGMVGFFFEYIVFSGILFTFDWFSMEKTLALVLIFSGISCLVAWKKGRFFLETLDFRKYVVPTLISLCILPLFGSLNGYYGMGQDQGVYQVKALFLMNDINENQLYFEEYDKLETPEEKAEYMAAVNDNLGFDRYDMNLFGNSAEEMLDETSGYFHGVQTFPALLALSGSLFGMEYMMAFQVIFLICTVYLLAFLCESLKIRKRVQLVVVGAFAFSPITLWVAKASLTELFIGVIVSAYMYLLAAAKGKRILLTAVPLVVFSFFHITNYTMMPLFVLIYMFLYLKTKDRNYLYADIINLVGYAVGFFTMILVNPGYVVNNYSLLYVVSFLNGKTLPVLVVGVSIFAILLHLVLLKLEKKPWEVWLNKLLSGMAFKIFVIVVVLGLAGLILLRKNETPFMQLTLMSYVVLSGVIIMPCLAMGFLYRMFKEKEFLTSNKYAVLLMGLMYVVMIYSAIFRVDIKHYYYYARYLVPYLPVIVIGFGMIFKKLKWPVAALCCVCLVLNYGKYDKILYAQQDDTRVQWEVIEDVLETLEDDSIVLLEDDLLRSYMLPIKADDSEVYLVSDNLNELTETFIGEEKDVYYVTNKMIADDMEEKYSIVSYEENFSSEDFFQFVGRTTHMPLDFTKNQGVHVVYQMNQPKTEYAITDEDFTGQGFGTVEGNFAWMEKEATIETYLQKKAYTLEITQGPAIAYDVIGRSLTLQVLVNGSSVGEIELNMEHNGKPLEFEVPEAVVKEGGNQVTLLCDTWSPEEIGNEDYRIIGIGFSKLTFK